MPMSNKKPLRDRHFAGDVVRESRRALLSNLGKGEAGEKVRKRRKAWPIQRMRPSPTVEMRREALIASEELYRFMFFSLWTRNCVPEATSSTMPVTPSPNRRKVSFLLDGSSRIPISLHQTITGLRYSSKLVPDVETRFLAGHLLGRTSLGLSMLKHQKV